jgi:hypothetical protein
MIATTTSAYNKNVVAKKTPYCDTCYRKGLSEKEYTSHYTKSEPGPRGVIVCPTILNSVCRSCGGKGHWASEKFCPLMRRASKVREVRKEQKPDVVVAKTNQNRFAALLDNEGHAVVVSDSVASTASLASLASLKTVASLKPSWADMAKKPAVLVPKEEPSPLTILKSNDSCYPKENRTPFMSDFAEKEAYKILQERKAAGCFDKEKRCSWLDSDSEDEEEW